MQQGFAVIDNALGDAWAGSLRSELLAWSDSGMMKPNCVQFQTADGPVVVMKPNIFETDMHDAEVKQPAACALDGFIGDVFGGADAFVKHVNALAPELALLEGQSAR